jgi:hypothetical protein
MRYDQDCPHYSTVEVYKGIFKCSDCGDIWDEATEDERVRREEGLEQGRDLQASKEARKAYFRRRYRGIP